MKEGVSYYKSKEQRKQQMKVTRARLLAQQLVADEMVETKDILQVQAMIAGIIFGNPALTDEEIGTELAHDLCFDLVFG